MQNKTDIFVSFLGNPFNDSRVINLYNSLKEKNLSCRIIGFNWESDYKYPSKENIEIIKLNKTSSLKFYFSFLISHFKSLKKSDAKIYFAEDIYTLPLSIFAARSKKAKVYYNSRELYSFIGGLRHRKFIQKIPGAFCIYKIFPVNFCLYKKTTVKFCVHKISSINLQG